MTVMSNSRTRNFSARTTQIGLNLYPDGVTFLPAWLTGVRAPFDPAKVQNGSYESSYNDAFSEGTVATTKRLGPIALVLGIGLGVAGVLFYQKHYGPEK